MSAIKATPTSVLLREYFNYTLMTSAATGSIIIAYSAAAGELPEFSTVLLSGWCCPPCRPLLWPPARGANCGYSQRPP